MRAKPFTRFTSLGPRLTVGQRACYKVAFDGLQPRDLKGEERERSRTIYGAVDVVPEAARRVFVQVKGRGVGGTRCAADRGVQLGATIPLAHVELDELVYVWFGGPKLRHARTGLRFARAEARRQGLRIVEDTTDYFTVVRHDGHRIRFEAFAASRGGDNVRGVHIAAAVLTEAGFYYDENNNANGEAIFGAIIPRLLAGGQIIIESTPWAEGSGLLWREFTDNWEHPTRAIAALCPTVVMRDDPVTLVNVQLEYERDPENAERELGASFLPAGTSRFFDQVAIAASIDDSLPAPLPLGWRPAA